MLGAKSVLVVRWLLGSVAGETRASWIWSYSTYICGYCEAGPEKPPGDLGNAAPTSGDSDRRETFRAIALVVVVSEDQPVSCTEWAPASLWPRPHLQHGVLSAFEGDSCPEVHTAVRASGFLQAGRGSGAEVPSLQGHPSHAVEGPPATAPGGDSWLCRSSADTL